MLSQPSNNDERRTYVKPVMTAVELAYEDDVLGSLGGLDGSEDPLDLFGDF